MPGPFMKFPKPLDPSFGPTPMNKRVDQRIDEKFGDQVREISPKKVAKEKALDVIVRKMGGQPKADTLPPELRAKLYGRAAELYGHPKYGKALENAAARSQAALMSQVGVLISTDPDFKTLWEKRIRGDPRTSE